MSKEDEGDEEAKREEDEKEVTRVRRRSNKGI